MSKTNSIHIICNSKSTIFWEKIFKDKRMKFKAVSITSEEQILEEKETITSELIIVDITGTKKISHLISIIKSQQSKPNIIITNFIPTWKQAREAFYLGAVDYIRKINNHDEMVEQIITSIAKQS